MQKCLHEDKSLITPGTLLPHESNTRRLHIPVNARAQNMFSRDIKRLSFRCQTLKFSLPLSDGMEPIDNYLAMQSCSSSSSGLFRDKQKLSLLFIRNIFPLSSV